MSDMPTVALRARTPDDLDVLFGITAVLDTWEERNPSAPAPRTREEFDARLARAAESEGPDDSEAFVVDVGFVRRNLRRIHLQAIASNAGAIRTHEKAGVVVEGRQHQHAWVRGS